MDEARESARNYIKSLPASDRVMLVRADALATPATAFESNRQVLDEAIRQSQAGASALNLEQAFEFAARAQKLQSRRAGEIVFVGAGRVAESEARFAAIPPNVRVLPVAASPENAGIRKIGLRRSPTAPDSWDIFVAVKNYGAKPHDIELALQFGGAPAGSKHMTLKPGAEEQATFSYRTRAAGYLEARIRYSNGARDAFPQDDRAVIELPAQKPLRVLVYSSEPQMLRPLIASNPQVEAVFESPAKYDPQAKADIVVFDRFAPPSQFKGALKTDSIWIEPPSAGSPIPVHAGPAPEKLDRWRADTALGDGLRTKDVRIESAETFTPASGDIVVAESKDGPLVVARPASQGGAQDGRKLIAIGFEPLRTSMKYELATPLLIANILRWMSPETFRRWEVQAGTVGTVNVALEKGADESNIRVLTEDQRPLPFTIEGNEMRFFAGAPGTVRVLSGDRETVYSLTLPDVADSLWQPPQSARRGIPRGSAAGAAVTDMWPWLAALGGLGLLIDWLWFGRSRALQLRAARMARSAARPGFRKAS